jgi:hypothetical protein
MLPAGALPWEKWIAVKAMASHYQKTESCKKTKKALTKT